MSDKIPEKICSTDDLISIGRKLGEPFLKIDGMFEVAGLILGSADRLQTLQAELNFCMGTVKNYDGKINKLKAENEALKTTTACPSCGCTSYMELYGLESNACSNCDQEWFSDINYSIETVRGLWEITCKNEQLTTEVSRLKKELKSINKGVERTVKFSDHLYEGREGYKEEAERLREALTTGVTPFPEFLRWVAARLVEVHDEHPNVDYALSLKERADRIEEALKPKKKTLTTAERITREVN